MSDLKEIRVNIPEAMIREFESAPRIVFKRPPAGLWPIPPELLKKTDFFKRLMDDKQFAENFEVVIMVK